MSNMERTASSMPQNPKTNAKSKSKSPTTPNPNSIPPVRRHARAMQTSRKVDPNPRIKLTMALRPRVKASLVSKKVRKSKPKPKPKPNPNPNPNPTQRCAARVMQTRPKRSEPVKDPKKQQPARKSPRTSKK